MGGMSLASDMLANAKSFAAEQIEPNAADWETQRRLPRSVMKSAGSYGLCGLLVPRELGGAGLSVSELTGVMESLAYSDMGCAFVLVVHNNLAAAIAGQGSIDVQARYLPVLLDGSMQGAFLLTEPDAGSNASAITTTAIERDGRWLLNGEKAWVTNAAQADLLRVYAQTDPGSGSRGIGAFLVRADQPGVVRTAPYEMLGAHATGTGGFRFENVELEAGQLFRSPGIAYREAMDAIGLARVVVASLCIGILRRGLETAIEYLKSRQAFGAALSEYQGLQWMLADVSTDIEAADGLTRAASLALDEDQPDGILKAAHAKKFAARAATNGLAQCMQALGANGFRQDRPIARHYAAAKMAHYIDGTTEVQNLLIARSLFDALR